MQQHHLSSSLPVALYDSIRARGQTVISLILQRMGEAVQASSLLRCLEVNFELKLCQPVPVKATRSFEQYRSYTEITGSLLRIKGGRY